MPFEGFIRVGQRSRSHRLDKFSIDNLLVFFVKIKRISKMQTFPDLQCCFLQFFVLWSILWCNVLYCGVTNDIDGQEQYH